MVKSNARNSWAEAEKKKAVKSGASDEVVVQLAQSDTASGSSVSSSFRFRKTKNSKCKDKQLKLVNYYGGDDDSLEKSWHVLHDKQRVERHSSMDHAEVNGGNHGVHVPHHHVGDLQE